MENYTNSKGIEWHFIPPKAPNFGGLWEAAVKSFKYHLVRTTSDTTMAYDELETLCVEIEAILNSRPLTALSQDPNDLLVLTPGHFLTGDSLKRVPEKDVRTIPDNRLDAWQQILKMKQFFWDRWHVEYLNNLIQRRKRSVENEVIKVGMLVLLCDEDLPSMQWSLGRIVELYPGKDNIVRTVSVKTKKNILKRPVSKIAILPTRDNDLSH